MGNVITSTDDLDDLDLDLDLDNSDVANIETETPITNTTSDDDELDLGDGEETIDDLELDDVVPDNKPNDTPVVDAERKDNLDDLDLDLDLDVNTNEDKEKTPEVKEEKVTKRKRRTKAEIEADRLEKEAYESERNSTETTTPITNVDSKKQPIVPVEPVSAEKIIQKMSEIVSASTTPTEVYDAAFEMHKIDAVKYAYLEKNLGIQNLANIYESSINALDGVVNPIHVVLENGNYHLFKGFNTYRAMLACGQQTVRVIIHSGIDAYLVTKMYIQAPHHLD